MAYGCRQLTQRRQTFLLNQRLLGRLQLLRALNKLAVRAFQLRLGAKNEIALLLKDFCGPAYDQEQGEIKQA